MAAKTGIRRELRRGTLELAILHLLTENDQYGYQLANNLAERTGGFLAIKEGTLYPLLYRLEENSWVKTYWKTMGRGNPRKYYRITEEGRKACLSLRQEWEEHVRNMKAFLEGTANT